MLHQHQQLLQATAIPTAKPGCKGSCGKVSVPFPFRNGPDCSLDLWFEVTCNETSSLPTIVLKRINMEVLNFSYSREWYLDLRVKSPIISMNCLGRGTEDNHTVDLTGNLFLYSDTRNKFIAAGCNNRALMAGIEPKIVGCDSACMNDDTLFGTSNPNKTCNGTTCCETVIPSALDMFNATFEGVSEGCKLAFLADQLWLDFNLTNPYDLQTMEYVPAWVDWSVPFDYDLYYTVGIESRCSILESTVNNISMRCYCQPSFQGNLYLRGRCRDINECLDEHYYTSCGDETCVNKLGYNTCEGSKTWAIALGLGVRFGVLCLVIVGWLLYKFLKKRRQSKLKRKFFKRNGGLLLQQQVHSHEVSLEKTEIFTSKELDKATDNFNQNRVLSQGGQDTVFKRVLVDGRIVAVKKSKAMAAEKVDDFINEVAILSQINHRNVVKLLGCCLETDVPLLVYEFISNGTLSE
ncbi:hypothetical protein like AT1G69730 [Hibiscus trionum]|uniref:Protein kinase domain-containing protein n=1 Tax=Hibiscus trionum TaxID=183268 RepID=A0A9W7GVG6_HIBTR|nr:hypothetical protein like AT1G69730 [Hibiscus trionum]